MTKFFSFFKHKVLSGMLLLLPIILITYLLVKLWKVIGAGIMKLAVILGVDRWVGVATLVVLTATAFVLICFLAGVVVHIASEKDSRIKLDIGFLRLFPGYSFIQMMLENRLGRKKGKVCVLVRIDEVWQPGLVIEENEYCCVVYFPNCPEPGSGTTCVVDDREKIRYLDVSVAKMNDFIERFGKGLADAYVSTMPRS